MKITFFSTNSNIYDGTTLLTKSFPAWKTQIESLLLKMPGIELSIVTQLPGMFLVDLNGNEIKEKASDVNYILVPQEFNEKQFAEKVMETNPDLAVAASFYVAPYDWLPINDALVSELLNAKGIKTLCHPQEASLLCFDKNQTQFILEKVGLNVPKTIFVHHQLFFCAGNRKEVNSNVYAQSVRARLRKMNYPVIIKDTVGLSSYGMEVCNTFEEADNFLKSKRNNSDRIIQELIHGIQAGCEIHGTPGNYKVLPPFIFSVNKYGITSPKQSVKLGPVTNNTVTDFHLNELETQLKSLSEELKLEGIAQVDLVFSESKWYVIEINPRLSGQSTTYAESADKSVIQLLLESTNLSETSKTATNLSPVMNFKLPLLDEETFNKIANLSYIKWIYQIQNLAAKQEREKGYCEIILSGNQTVSSLLENLEDLKIKFPSLIEDVFYKNALELSELLKCK